MNLNNVLFLDDVRLSLIVIYKSSIGFDNTPKINIHNEETKLL